MFSRTIINELRQWALKANRKPLVLRGARQVGKTYAVRLFGQEFDRFIEMNLDLPQEADLFNRGLSVQDLFQAILLNKNAPKVKSGARTLLFLDEIQNSPNAINYLRYFREKLPEIFVIAAGSLLDAVLAQEEITFPVGRVEYSVVRPLSFLEFLSATNEEQALEAIENVPLKELGGMPEIVANLRESGEISGLDSVYKSLLIGYLDDALKYSRNDTLKKVIRHCIEVAPFEAGRRITLEGFGNSNYRSREVGEALKLIEKAMLISLLRPSTSVQPPIQPDFRKKPRLQFLDTGLINYFVDIQKNFFTYADLHNLYKGIIAEHIVGQELLCLNPNPLQKLCFWVRDKNPSLAEVDFLIQHNQKIVPIEVKAGKTGTLRSLHQFIDASQCDFAIRLYAGNIQLDDLKTSQGKSFKLLNLPYFLVGKINQYIDLFS
jgi:predicted AAA+ superfamily ATPase